MSKYYILLALAILFEVMGTLLLKLTANFQHLIYTPLVTLAYVASFILFGFALRGISVSMAYAIWCGLGILSMTCLDKFFYQERFDALAFIGLGLVIFGVLCLTLSRNVELPK